MEVDIIYHIHNRLKVFLQLCNMTCLDNVETRVLLEFGEIQWRVEQGECITSIPIWVEFPTSKECRGRKSEINSGGGTVQTQQKTETEKNK